MAIDHKLIRERIRDVKVELERLEALNNRMAKGKLIVDELTLNFSVEQKTALQGLYGAIRQRIVDALQELNKVLPEV